MKVKMVLLFVLVLFSISFAAEHHKDPPPGWRIQYNAILKEYRWIDDKGFVSIACFDCNTRQGAVNSAWYQLEFRKNNPKFIENDSVKNWEFIR